MDKRLGKVGETEPFLCAVTMQHVRGRHSTHYQVGDGYYIAILEKAAMKMSADEVEEVRDELRAFIPRTQSAPKKKSAPRTEATTPKPSEE